MEPVWEKVIKNYPATTHAHTVEFRLSSKANLQQIEQSLEQAWTYNKGASSQDRVRLFIIDRQRSCLLKVCQS